MFFAWPIPDSVLRQSTPAGRTGPRQFAAAMLVVILVAAGCSGERPTFVASDVLVPTVTGAASSEPVNNQQPTAPEQAPATALPVIAAMEASTSPVACLTLRQQIGQTLMPLVVQSELAAAEPLVAAGDIGGVVLLGQSNANLGTQLGQLHAAVGVGVPIHVGSDEEGGVVQRLSNLLGPIPSAQEQAQDSPEAVRAMMAAYGITLADLGVTMVFAPVIDVGGGPGIGSRSFSDDPAVVSIYGAAVSDGFREAGLVPVLKHFPGHGRASGDSHLGLPSTPPLAELRSLDLLPFQSLLPLADAVMVAHLVVPGLTEDLPTSLSAATINGLLRSEFGFAGLVMTDALNMQAIDPGWTQAEAALMTLNAGTDIAMITGLSDVEPVIDALMANVAQGTLTEDRVAAAALNVLASKGQSDFCANLVG